MQLLNEDIQRYLDLVERARTIYFWDTESQGLEGDYGRLYVTAIKPYGREPTVLSIGPNGQDKGLAKETKDILETADCWVTFYGKEHDVRLVNTRLTRWGYAPLVSKHHIDMYFVLASRLKLARRSQAQALGFLQGVMESLGLPVMEKMGISPNVWSDLFADFHKNILLLRQRCKSDTEGLETVYRCCKTLIRDIKKG